MVSWAIRVELGNQEDKQTPLPGIRKNVTGRANRKLQPHPHWNISFSTRCSKENASMDPRQKEFYPSSPLVWVGVKINAFAVSVLHPCEIHRPRESHVIRSVCVQVVRELTKPLPWICLLALGPLASHRGLD